MFVGIRQRANGGVEESLKSYGELGANECPTPRGELGTEFYKLKDLSTVGMCDFDYRESAFLLVC